MKKNEFSQAVIKLAKTLQARLFGVHEIEFSYSPNTLVFCALNAHGHKHFYDKPLLSITYILVGFKVSDGVKLAFSEYKRKHGIDVHFIELLYT